MGVVDGNGLIFLTGPRSTTLGCGVEATFHAAIRLEVVTGTVLLSSSSSFSFSVTAGGVSSSAGGLLSEMVTGTGMRDVFTGGGILLISDRG